MELPVGSVSDCTPHAMIMFLVAQNENASTIHPQNSPDLAYSVYHLFGIQKASLSGQHFTTNTEVEKWMRAFFADLDRNVYDAGIRKLMPYYEKCLELRLNYVEK